MDMATGHYRSGRPARCVVADLAAPGPWRGRRRRREGV